MFADVIGQGEGGPGSPAVLCWEFRSPSVAHFFWPQCAKRESSDWKRSATGCSITVRKHKWPLPSTPPCAVLGVGTLVIPKEAAAHCLASTLTSRNLQP